MKSKDQQLLEEAYASIMGGGKYTDNYGRSKFKPKGKPLSDFDDSAREELRNRERNAGLEDDVPAISTTPSQPSSPRPQVAAAPEVIDFDLSALADKDINPVMWDYPDVVMQINGKTVGPMFSKEEGVELAKLLKAGDITNPLVQRFLKGAKNLGDLDKLK